MELRFFTVVLSIVKAVFMYWTERREVEVACEEVRVRRGVRSLATRADMRSGGDGGEVWGGFLGLLKLR